MQECYLEYSINMQFLNNKIVVIDSYNLQKDEMHHAQKSFVQCFRLFFRYIPKRFDAFNNYLTTYSSWLCITQNSQFNEQVNANIKKNNNNTYCQRSQKICLADSFVGKNSGIKNVLKIKSALKSAFIYMLFSCRIIMPLKYFKLSQAREIPLTPGHERLSIKMQLYTVTQPKHC